MNTASDQRARTLGRWQALGIDTVLIVLFAAFGRFSHDGNLDPSGIARIGAPFLLGLAAAWLLLSIPQFGAAVGRDSVPQWYARWRFGIGVSLLTVAVGMVLRRLVWDDGTAAAFVVVAVLFVSAILIGWRLVVATSHPGGR